MNNNETKYCEDFCPIYESVERYNKTHENKIYCPSIMCDRITEVYEKNKNNK